ncbi:MAG: photosystem II assembly protein [Symploca sp. SIO3E6]|nr:photosystem II assembly protein [Caldora sp. SIO3E6]
MINPLANWWRSYQFRAALKQGSQHLARQQLQKIQSSGARLSLLEQLFKDKLQSEASLYDAKKIIKNLRISRQQSTVGLEAEPATQRYDIEQSLAEKQQEIASLQEQVEKLSHQREQPLITPNQELIAAITSQFQLNAIDENLLQCTGIDEQTFYELESNLVTYLESEFEGYTPQSSLYSSLTAAYEDINLLTKGQDPHYNSPLTPHVYFMLYFLESVYSAYIAWFFVYQSGLLPTRMELLDIAAGSGSLFYGLFYFLRTATNFTPLSQNIICYCSLEQEPWLQYHGREFWQQYVEPNTTATVNSYFRFNAADLFIYGSNSDGNRELPKNFFDFITISHCIFADQEKRQESHQIYRRIFNESLKDNGYVLLVVQGRRLFKTYGYRLTENPAEEQNLMRCFLDELGLKLEWYKYLSSTGKRTPIQKTKFAKFAAKNLPPNTYMNPLIRQYLKRRFDSHYVLDDYVVLGKK